MAEQLVMGNWSAAVRLADGTVFKWGKLGGEAAIGPSIVAGIADAKDLVMGDGSACVRLSGGAVQCWGENGQGELGDGTTTMHLGPTTIAPLAGFTDLALGSLFSCSHNGGNAQCWGHNVGGVLGDNTTSAHYLPAAVVTSTKGTPLIGVSQISAGNESACAIDSYRGGAVQCWGTGPLGTGEANRLYASDVKGLVRGNLEVAVSLGGRHACAILGDRTVQCWGSNRFGQLGDGTKTDRPTPIAVEGLDGTSHLALGVAYSCALRLDGTARCWGTGLLGDGTNGEHLTAISPRWP